MILYSSPGFVISVVSKPCHCLQLRTNFKPTPFIYHFKEPCSLLICLSFYFPNICGVCLGHHAVTWEHRSDLSTDIATNNIIRSRREISIESWGHRKRQWTQCATWRDSHRKLEDILNPCIPMNQASRPFYVTFCCLEESFQRAKTRPVNFCKVNPKERKGSSPLHHLLCPEETSKPCQRRQLGSIWFLVFLPLPRGRQSQILSTLPALDPSNITSLSCPSKCLPGRHYRGLDLQFQFLQGSLGNVWM